MKSYSDLTEIEKKKIITLTKFPLGFNPEKTHYILYHGTNNINADKIIKSGLVSENYQRPKWFVLTTNIRAAKHFSLGYDNEKTYPVVIRFDIPISEIQNLLFKGGETSFEDVQHALKEKIPIKYITESSNVSKSFVF